MKRPSVRRRQWRRADTSTTSVVLRRRPAARPASSRSSVRPSSTGRLPDVGLPLQPRDLCRETSAARQGQMEEGPQPWLRFRLGRTHTAGSPSNSERPWAATRNPGSFGVRGRGHTLAPLTHLVRRRLLHFASLPAGP
ncbi:hypothetical protein CDD83_7205 [Cordyceps sp. RAO-2017]|nr:hypothetical protein CDD83_7205 [Cordyceps sp. RAO-2017]